MPFLAVTLMVFLHPNCNFKIQKKKKIIKWYIDLLVVFLSYCTIVVQNSPMVILSLLTKAFFFLAGVKETQNYLWAKINSHVYMLIIPIKVMPWIFCIQKTPVSNTHQKFLLILKLLLTFHNQCLLCKPKSTYVYTLIIGKLILLFQAPNMSTARALKHSLAPLYQYIPYHKVPH